MKSLATASFAILSMLVASVSFSAEMPDGAKPFVVAFHKESCMMCRVQSTVLKEEAQSPDFMGITLFTIRFNTEKLLERSLGITKQSAMVGLEDDRERGTRGGTSTLR